MIIQCPACQLRYDVSHRAPGTRARCRCGHTFEVPAASVESSRAVRCSGCGAQNASTDRSCHYCGTALATVSCPACLTLNPKHYQHCSQCGGSLHGPARDLEEREEERPLQCPRCEQALEARLLADTLVDQCTSCGGVFLDHDVLSSLLKDRARQAPLRERMMQLPSSGPLANPREVTYLRCPECATLMTRRNPAHRSGIIVDVCASHGVWFDDRELAILMQLASTGAELNVSPRPVPLASVPSAPSGSPPLPRMPERRGDLDRFETRRRGEAIDVDLGDVVDFIASIKRFF